MLCPVDGETLVMADRGGVEIDYCPKCRGVWLDRGELDKIIERSLPAAPSARPEPTYAEPRRDSSRHRDHDDDDYHHGRRPKRRDSFLSDIFDF